VVAGILEFSNDIDDRAGTSVGFAEDTEQRLAGGAQSVVDLLAAAARLGHLRLLEPREVRGDRRGAQAKLTGEFGRGARHGEAL
jgi:hypothetical protein